MKNFIQKHLLLIIIIIIYLSPTIISYISTSLEESTGPNDYARITDVDYQAVLIDDYYEGSKAIITEQLTYDIHAASKSNLFWELWRDLPEDNVDGLKVDYKVISVKQLNKDGTTTTYTESPKLYWDDYDYTSPTYGPGKWYHSEGPYDEYYRQYECVFFYVNGLYREEVTFEIQYEMNNPALRYSDVSELYLSMYSEETIKHLESFKGEILIPNKDMPKEGNYIAHTYGTNNHTFDFTESDTIHPGFHTFSINLDEDDLKFRKYNEYIEFSLLAFNEDKHIFTNHAPANIYSNDVYLEEAKLEMQKYDNLPEVAKKNKKILFNASIIISILVLISTINKKKNIKKKNQFYEPTTKMQYFREIPSNLDPYFAASLAFIKNKKKANVGDSYSALMLSLVKKEYIELQKIDNNKTWTPDNILIKILFNQSLNDMTSILENLTLNNNINQTPTTNVYQSQPNSTYINQMNISNEKYNIKGKKLEKLTTNEEKYFNLITKYATNSQITMEIFQNRISTDYDNTNTFVTSVENSIVNIGISEGYFQKSKYDSIKQQLIRKSNTYLILGLLITILGNIVIYHTRLDLAFGGLFILGITLLISAIYLKKIANKYILLTQYGEDEYAKWKALYDFLNSETLMKERTVIELPLWEEYLIYATAFGISDKVIKALEINCPDTSESIILNNDYYRSSNFRTNSRSFSTATKNASFTSRSYSSFGGGSHYGGGGRGGGGGGGGH